MELEVYDRYVIIWLFLYHTQYQPETPILAIDIFDCLAMDVSVDIGCGVGNRNTRIKP
jgi:hypothetical protein